MSNTSELHQISEPVLERAIAWAVALGAEAVDENTRHAFGQWLRAHPMHGLAWQRLQVVESEFSGLTPESAEPSRTSAWRNLFLRVCVTHSA